MLYHFANVDFLEIALNYSLLFNENDVIVLDKSVINRINYPEDGKIILDLANFSKNTKTILLVASKIICGDIFNSIIVFSKGKLIGISNKITKTKYYANANSLDIYVLGSKKYAILINEDIYINEIKKHLLTERIDYILHIDEDEFKRERSNILAAYSIKNSIKAYSLFNDCSIFYNNSGGYRQIEIGKLRRMNRLK